MKTSLLFCLLLAPLQLFAQTSMEFYQGNTKIGTLLSVDSWDAIVHILTPSGYIITYDGYSIEWGGVSFETPDCTGQAYLTHPTYTNDATSRGGEILQAYGSTVVKTELFPAWAYRVMASRKGGDGSCVALPEPESRFTTPVVTEDASKYGMVLLEDGSIGFNPKLTIKILNNNDVISCDGFESCPTP